MYEPVPARPRYRTGSGSFATIEHSTNAPAAIS
jgi:hypothetical protein